MIRGKDEATTSKDVQPEGATAGLRFHQEPTILIPLLSIFSPDELSLPLLAARLHRNHLSLTSTPHTSFEDMGVQLQRRCGLLQRL